MHIEVQNTTEVRLPILCRSDWDYLPRSAI